MTLQENIEKFADSVKAGICSVDIGWYEPILVRILICS